jgi:type II secretory ATPase GspE/PulE/Tfp pilus assembly ATPase PilB-like protein
VDFRVSTLPTVYGEKAVIRLLYGRAARLRKDELGFFPDDLARLERLFRRPYGAVFMTGPTGSGKSTTLSCFLEDLATSDINVVTVEDPVENPIPGVNHMNIEPGAGLNFANALRHILRQDPDVIMVGEIRDAETAHITVQAAVTGHLVLSTLHTNDAAGVLERLVDMGIEPYLAAGALAGVVSQRLVRRLCPYCKHETVLPAEETALLSLPEGTQGYESTGCERCRNTGYRGRFALYEYFVMDERLRRRMIQNPQRFAARMRSGKHAGPKIIDNGVRNILAGNTSASEVIRAINMENNITT